MSEQAVPVRADARRNYRNLLLAAKEVFAEQGAMASLRDVARRADVAIGTLYRHFPTREALLEAVLHEGFLALGAAADELLASATPGAALLDWLARFSTSPGACRGLPEMMLAAVRDENDALHASCVAMYQAASRLLARAQEVGEADPAIHPDGLFAAVMAIRWVAESGGPDDAAHVLAMLATGLTGPDTR